MLANCGIQRNKKRSSHSKISESAKILSPILYKPWLHGLSHITGGGIIENTHRIIEKNQDIKINWDSWERPEIFKLIQREGNIKFKDIVGTGKELVL